MISVGMHTVLATPPTIANGFSTVCPPVTCVSASVAQSCWHKIQCPLIFSTYVWIPYLSMQKLFKLGSWVPEQVLIKVQCTFSVTLTKCQSWEMLFYSHTTCSSSNLQSNKYWSTFCFVVAQNLDIFECVIYQCQFHSFRWNINPNNTQNLPWSLS